MLCRYQAHELQRGLKELLEGLGVGMACILHEWVPAEVRLECLLQCRATLERVLSCTVFQVEKFAKYWKGPIYLDKAMDFYKVGACCWVLQQRSLTHLKC